MNYINEQLFKAIPMSLTDRNAQDDRNGQIYLKIRTQNGQTNWLNVSPDNGYAIWKYCHKGKSPVFIFQSHKIL